MNRCELCKGKARMYCESDQASLCWDCDAKVHSANFLVARHPRNLLCHVCSFPTPWSASGAKLGPTFIVCEQCVNGRSDEIEAEYVEEAEEEDCKEVVDENQVVPWSPPPADDCSSSSDESVSGDDVAVSRKRRRLQDASSNPSPEDDDHGCTSNLESHPSPSESAAVVKDLPSKRKTTTFRNSHGAGVRSG